MGTFWLFKPPQEIRELNLLQELEKNPVISQRELSHKFGIALGVTNACLKRMVLRGWIRIMNFNHHKIGYYLTPKGLAEKAKLTLYLITWTVQHYSTLKEIIGQKLLEMEQSGVKRIVFYGVSDEMEIAYITLQGVNLNLIGVVEDPERKNRTGIFGFEVKDVSHIETLKPDGILITSLIGLDERKERLRQMIDITEGRVWDISNP
jgi:DNA-binding MarR family transcriptional regulator